MSCSERLITDGPYCCYYLNPQVSLLADNSHPKQDTSPKEDAFKNGDINVDFSQLTLDDKGQHKKYYLYSC